MAEKKQEPKSIPTAMNFLIGGLSGMLSNCVVQPADLVKTRMQLRGPSATSITVGKVIKDIIKKDGLLGFYNGLSAGLFRQATYTTFRMGVFSGILDWYQGTHGPANFGIKIVFGMIAGGIGAFVGTPAELVLIRMTADGRLPPEKRRNYKHVFNALGRIIREEGVTGLWTGTVPTVSRAMVLNAAQLGTYAQVREMSLTSLGEGVPLQLISSMTAGLVSTIASLPLDIIKTRVQNAGKEVSQIEVLRRILRKEGVLALWSGFLPAYAKIGPNTIITFFFLEQLKALYLKLA